MTNPDQKEKMMADFKKMGAEKPTTIKTLREVMRYNSSEVPDVSNESALAALAAKRDKTAYENWKRTTVNQIKANKGKLPWADEL